MSHHFMHQQIPTLFHPDLVFEEPVARPVEGMPIGNGRMGTLVWTTPSSVVFQINRMDVFRVNRKASGDHCGEMKIIDGVIQFPTRPGGRYRILSGQDQNGCSG